MLARNWKLLVDSYPALALIMWSGWMRMFESLMAGPSWWVQRG